MELASARETRAVQFVRALFAVLITLRIKLGIALGSRAQARERELGSRRTGADQSRARATSRYQQKSVKELGPVISLK